MKQRTFDSSVFSTLLIIQAIVTLILFLGQGTSKYITLVLFGLIDAILFIGLLLQRWDYAETFAFASIISSIPFAILYIGYTGGLNARILILGIAVSILFTISAILFFIQKAVELDNIDENIDDITPKHDITLHNVKAHTYHHNYTHPVEKSRENDIDYDYSRNYPAYSEEELDKELDEIEEMESQSKNMFREKSLSKEQSYQQEKYDNLIEQTRNLEKVDEQIRKFQDVMRKKQLEDNKQEEKVASIIKIKTQKQPSVSEDAKKKARALAYELEREALSIKKAEKYLNKANAEHKTDEVMTEGAILENMEKQLRYVTRLNKQQSVVNEAKKLVDVNRTLKKIDIANKQQAFLNEAKRLEDATRALKKIDTVNNQRTVLRQAKTLEDMDRQIRELKLSLSNPKSNSRSVLIKNKDNTKDISNKKKRLVRDAKELINADKIIKQIQFLNKQQKIIAEAKKIAEVQKKLDKKKR